MCFLDKESLFLKFITLFKYISHNEFDGPQLQHIKCVKIQKLKYKAVGKTFICLYLSISKGAQYLCQNPPQPVRKFAIQSPWKKCQILGMLDLTFVYIYIKTLRKPHAGSVSLT